MFRIKGVFHPDGNVLLGHFYGSLGVDGFHVQVGHLIGDVEIRLPDHPDFLGSDQNRVPAAKMVLLVDDAFAGAGQHGQFAEGDFAITARELSHNADVTFDEPGDDGQFRLDVDILHPGQ